tara:strand:+ start:378 stop:977 length:600 start_codon:yes stop_codon:yes gene_type:complete
MSGFKLSKGSSLNLSKETESLKIAGIGLGWNTDADLDVSAFCVGEDGHIPEMADFVFYGSQSMQVLEGEDGPRPCSADASVYGALDGLEENEGDDQDMWIYFDRIADNIKEIIIVVTIHIEEGGTKVYFSSISGCYCRIWDQSSEKELCRYALGNDFGAADSLEIGKFSRDGDGWIFTALGNECQGGLTGFIKKYAYKF